MVKSYGCSQWSVVYYRGFRIFHVYDFDNSICNDLLKMEENIGNSD